MRPPLRTISTARRIKRSCGFSGCNSKYWLTDRRYHTRRLPQAIPMQTLIELAPLIAFFVAYKFLGGIYPATAVLMVAMLLLLAWDWLRLRKVPQMHLVSAILVWVFGVATLLL